MKFDLHIHSFFSDGRNSPEKIIDLSLERNLDGIAITDHDNISGIDRAVKYSCNENNFGIIPGIEFSSIHSNTEVHILGYFKDYNHPLIIEAVEFLKNSRIERGIKIIKKLNELGINISCKDVLESSDKKFVGRVPIARALVNGGYVNNIQEGFDKYLNRGKDGYIEKEGLSITETIKLVKDVGGISVVAHPGLLENENILDYCINEGINGIECIHSKHSINETKYFKEIARKHSLIQTGGSDCHGEIINGDILLGKYYINLELIPELREMIR